LYIGHERMEMHNRLLADSAGDLLGWTVFNTTSVLMPRYGNPHPSPRPHPTQVALELTLDLILVLTLIVTLVFVLILVLVLVHVLAP
jgi:hypothetical protein